MKKAALVLLGLLLASSAWAVQEIKVYDLYAADSLAGGDSIKVSVPCMGARLVAWVWGNRDTAFSATVTSCDSISSSGSAFRVSMDDVNWSIPLGRSNAAPNTVYRVSSVGDSLSGIGTANIAWPLCAGGRVSVVSPLSGVSNEWSYLTWRRMQLTLVSTSRPRAAAGAGSTGVAPIYRPFVRAFVFYPDEQPDKLVPYSRWNPAYP